MKLIEFPRNLLLNNSAAGTFIYLNTILEIFENKLPAMALWGKLSVKAEHKSSSEGSFCALT
jgi:hypothetical protein